jgi:hypothetical protein
MEQLIGFRLLNKRLPTSNGLYNIETIWNKYFLRFCVGAACLHTHGSSSGAVGKCAEWFIPKSRSFSSPSFSSPASALHLSFGIYHHYLNQLITRDITYVVSGMSHQVSNRHYSWLSLWFDAWSDDMPFVAAQKNPGPSTSPCRQGVEWRWSTTKMGSSNVVPSSYLGRPGREHNGRVGLWGWHWPWWLNHWTHLCWCRHLCLLNSIMTMTLVSQSPLFRSSFSWSDSIG